MLMPNWHLKFRCMPNWPKAFWFGNIIYKTDLRMSVLFGDLLHLSLTLHTTLYTSAVLGVSSQHLLLLAKEFMQPPRGFVYGKLVVCIKIVGGQRWRQFNQPYRRTLSEQKIKIVQQSSWPSISFAIIIWELNNLERLSNFAISP